jgi:antirestriction protein
MTRDELIENHFPEAAIDAYEENIGDLENFEDQFIGIYDGDSDFEAVGNYIEEVWGDVSDIPAPFNMYIDWTAMGRDEILGGSIWTERIDSRYVIFSNH